MNILKNEKICMVTGATSGIGLATARGLAKLGLTTIIVGRNLKKCEQVCSRIISETGNQNLSYSVADLSSQKDIHRLVEKFKNEHDRLDVLVNNAGAKFVTRHITTDGLEMTLALNHLAYFMLTLLLINRLKSAGNSRIINVSSGVHSGAIIDFNDPQNEKAYVGKIAYGQSKLANLLFTYELARRVKGTGIAVNAMSPGGVITNFCKNNGWISWAKHVTAHILSKNLIRPATAAGAITYLATASDLQGVSGQYFYNRAPVTSSSASYDLDGAKRLWKLSANLVNLKDVEDCDSNVT